LKKRQAQTIDGGTIDLLFEDKEGNPVVVELKLSRIGRGAVNQLKRYMKWVRGETKKRGYRSYCM
jgi:RecB family endonuclease NucS